VDKPGNAALISPTGLDALIRVLAARGYRVVGPRLSDGAITYDDIAGLGDLPVGWRDRHGAGRYRLERRADKAAFGYVVGPHSWKRFLHPPSETLWTVRKTDSGFELETDTAERPRFAFIGVRACEISAIAVQDRVFIDGSFKDKPYESRRRDAFIVAVNCAEPGETCFCVSMHTGPKVSGRFDLCLTELVEGDRHAFVVETGSEAGVEILAEVPHKPAGDGDIAAAQAVSRHAADNMGRELETAGLKELLQGSPTHPQWEKVAERCLTCGNCTMVCPTCFCTTVVDHSDLTGSEAMRTREWDSCFTLDFSHIHGGSVRKSTSSRYRQWMTHKLAHWYDQFGTSGCVGCGRCITWCPVGIDITEEAAAMRVGAGAAKAEAS